LAAAGVPIDFIASDELESASLRDHPLINFLNLRGDMRPDAPLWRKVVRTARYYARLLHYAATSRATVFHVLWNNKFELFDRTVVLSYYRLLGKRLVLTVHNVNVRKRDGNDTLLNRLSLRYQYAIADHLFVHTQRMADELVREFCVARGKVSVIPFGINSTVPDTALTPQAARDLLDLGADEKVLLFFGNIARYKGLDRLVDAMPALLAKHPRARLVIAGRPKGEESYWAAVERRIDELGIGGRVTRRIEYVPDEQTEIFFKAADVLVLPYTHVFQSGVLFLGYNFGLPVVATDVGSLREEIVEDQTGCVCESGEPQALSVTLDRYFAGPLFADLAQKRSAIRAYAAERYSWATVASISKRVYSQIGGASGDQAKRKLA
jgi:glycosyltransferase involved in cell wall biosynthesis